MATNESKKFPPLSDAFKVIQKDMKVLDMELKENLKVREQLRKDLRAGLTTQAQADELDAKLRARNDEILIAMGELAMATGSVK